MFKQEMHILEQKVQNALQSNSKDPHLAPFNPTANGIF